MSVQVIEKNGKPEYAVIPYAEYQRLMELLEQRRDEAAIEKFYADLEAGKEELVPKEVVNRILDGEHPLKVWRDHRGLTLQALAAQIGVTRSYLSQIESRKKKGSMETVRKLAEALGVEIEDLVD